jgi:thermitase
MMKMFFINGAVILWLGFLPLIAPAETPIHLNLIDGNRLSLTCQNAPLREVLQQLTRHAVTVRMDPRVEGRLTLQLPSQSLENALPRILSGWDYVLVWDQIPGPMGGLARLSEIQVFPKGGTHQLETLKPIAPETTTHRERQRISRFVKGEVLLRLKPGVSAEAFRKLLQKISGTIIESYPTRGIYRVVVPDSTDLLKLIQKLQGDSLIARAEPNYVYPLPGRENQISSSSKAYAGKASILTDGHSVPLAILDSGLTFRDDLKSLVLTSLDSTDPTRPLGDTQGHGTQMALIGGGLINPAGIVDSPGLGSVPLIPIRTFDDQGYATSLTLTRSVDYAVANGAQVINMSWGSEDASGFLEEAITQGLNAQVLMVAAVGNEPTGQAMYPAAIPGVIGVAASGPDGSLWVDSNSGSFVDLTAPGFASLPIGYEGPPGDYIGTSISSVFVARTLANYLGQHPQTPPADAVTRLLGSLSPVPAGSSTNGWGSGILDQAAITRFFKTP